MDRNGRYGNNPSSGVLECVTSPDTHTPFPSPASHLFFHGPFQFSHVTYMSVLGYLLL